MKILFVLDTGFDTPGPSNHLMESIIEQSLIDGNSVHIIESHRTGSLPDIPSKLLEYKGLTYDIIHEKKVKKANFIIRYLGEVKYVLKCRKKIKKIPDVDIVFMQSCNTAALHIFFLKHILKKPIVLNIQDLFPENTVQIGLLKKKGIIYKFLNKLQNYAFENAKKIITISDDIKNSLIESRVDAQKIDVIYNWSYSDDIIEIANEDNVFIKENNIMTDKFKVVYAGNLGKLQNVNIIMLAAKELKDARNITFYIIGDGVYKEKYINMVKEYNLTNVVFLPIQSSKYAPYIYAMADINIIPLAKGIIKTALPSKTAICLSVGKPIIACIDKDSSFANLINSCDNCSVVDSNDYISLSREIKVLSQNKSIKSSNSRLLFKEKFLKSTNSFRYVQLLKSVYNKN